MAHDHGAIGPAYVSPDPEYAVTPPGAAYEHTDASIWLIVRFAVWLVISAVVIHVGIWLVFILFVEQREATTAPEFPLAVGSGQRLPAEPRLQRFPANEALDIRLRDDAALTNYEWVDRNAGTVRIPISEAMRLTVERGLPSRPAVPDGVKPGEAPAQGAETPGLIPADSSSGRTMESRRQ